MNMNFENNNAIPNDFAAMMGVWEQIQVLGRNDIENAAGMQIIADVQSGKITARDGRQKMQALLESKQEH